MSSSRKSEQHDPSNLWADFLRAPAANLTGPLLDQFMSCSQKCLAWNSEVARFVGGRISDDGATLLEIAQCGGLPKALEIQQAWFRRAVEDYFNETRRYM